LTEEILPPSAEFDGENHPLPRAVMENR
jgi:hypothetical protein